MGEAVLAAVLSERRHRQVRVLTTGPMSSSTRGLDVLPIASLLAGTEPSSDPALSDPAPLPGDAYLCLSDPTDPLATAHHGRDAIYAALPDPATVLAVSSALVSRGVRRLMLIAPLAAWQHVSAAGRMLPEGLEIDLGRLPIPIVIVVRPVTERAVATAPEDGSRLQRFARFYLSQLRFMLPASTHPMRAVEIARAAIGLMAEIDRPGLTVVPMERIRHHADVHHGNPT